MRDKSTYFLLLLITILCLWMCSEAKADEIGVSPDQYDAIWESATEEDMEALKAVVWLESARAFDEEDTRQNITNIAVVETVLNRVLCDEFPSTISKVVKQRGHFYYRNIKVDSEAVSVAIEHVKRCGRTVLPDYDYYYFATKKQSLGKDHVWYGVRKENGKPLKGKGMWFCRGKK